jgi:RNA polymerase sigma factor (sigma-70 family)
VTPWLTDALLRTQTDERLISLAREGHERAFVIIIERYRRPLHAYAARLVQDGRAEDVLQQALINAWSALAKGTEVAHVRGWLHEIVRNAAWRASRDRTVGELPADIPAAGRPDEQVERSLLLRSTFAQLGRMPERQRDAFVQTAMQGRSREEVAGALGVTEGAVRQLVHRARTTLRAAATALTPMPAISWAAASSQPVSSVSGRIAELVTGAGASAGAGILLKSGAAVLAVGVAAGGAGAIHHHQHQQAARATTAPPATASAAPAVAGRQADLAPVAALPRRSQTQASHSDRGRSRIERHEVLGGNVHEDRPTSAGDRSGRDERPPASGTAENRRSGSSSSGSDDLRPTSSGDGHQGGTATGAPSGGDDGQVSAAVATPLATDSGDSAHGDDRSGTSGSGGDGGGSSGSSSGGGSASGGGSGGGDDGATGDH